MVLTRFVRFQLVIFTAITIVALVVMATIYMQAPAAVGIGKQTLYVQLPETGGIYGTANVTYRGVTVGKVQDVALRPDGVLVKAQIDSGERIPFDLTAEVHSQSAIGEQYIDLVPRHAGGPYLSDGYTIPEDRVTVPQQIGPMIDQVDTALNTLEPGALTKLIDESNLALEGTGPALSQLLSGSSELVTDARGELDTMSRLVANAQPLLRSQIESEDAIAAWVTTAADITSQMSQRDAEFEHILTEGPRAADEANDLFQKARPTLPILLANMVSLSQVAVTYNASLEQLLVLLPQGVSGEQAITVTNNHTTGRGTFAFNLNLNLPEPCTVGFLPASERRDGSAVDAPERTDTPLYCAVSQDDPNAVRGARNLPCMDKPGKRAPTVEICKSDEEYVPQGEGTWIGPPKPVNFTEPDGTPAVGVQDSGQGTYNPRSGEYVGPDGKTYAVEGDSVADQRQLDAILSPAG